jgi:histidinol-phosphate aminotransferase
MVGISRRNLLRSLGGVAAGGAAISALGGSPIADAGQPHWGEDHPGGPVFLDHNENAYGPSEKVQAAIRNASSSSSRYPRFECDSLVSRIAALHRVTPEHVLLGCGSTDILRQAAANLIGPGEKLVQASPTFPALGAFARSRGVEVLDVPLNKRHQYDIDALLAGVGNSAGLVYICNPNNPTGTVTPRVDTDRFLAKVPGNIITLIDEAYYHYVVPSSSYASYLDRPSANPRVLVCRTFSAAYGLAGLRIGYAVGAPELVRRLSAGQLPYGIGSISAIAAVAAIDDVDYLKLAVQRNANDRQEFMNRINVAMLRAFDSHSNFVLFDTMRPADMVFNHLKNHGVVVAPPVPEIERYLRVSLGTPPEMREFWRVMDLLPPTGKMAM